MAWSFTSPLSSRHLRDHDPPWFGSRRSRNDHQRPSFDCAANRVGTKQTAAPRALPPLKLPIIKAAGTTSGFINPISQGKSSLALEQAALFPHLEQPRGSFSIVLPLILPYCASQRSLDRNFLFSGYATWLHIPCPSSNPPGEHVIVASLSNPVTLGVLPPCLPPVLGN
ncbi:hypothetical protein AMTRI_Chr02g224540 [Amborella trichopoda]